MFTNVQQQVYVPMNVVPYPPAPQPICHQPGFASQQQLAQFWAYQQAVNAQMQASAQPMAYGMPGCVNPQPVYSSQAHWGQFPASCNFTAHWGPQAPQCDAPQRSSPPSRKPEYGAPPSVLWTPSPSPDNKFKNFLKKPDTTKTSATLAKGNEKLALDDEEMAHVVELMGNLLDDYDKTPANTTTTNETITYREQKEHIYFDRENKTIKSTIRKTEMPLLNGLKFTTKPGAPVWPMYSIMPVEADQADLNERIRKQSIKLERYYRNYKTTMCKSVIEGKKCTREASCCFAHTEEERRAPLENKDPRRRTQLCRKYYAFKFCKFGDKCDFAHPK
ncbi:unnamed protein product [Bursaphelenchus okinawaensis]|uniref:C3H1-type domain-containing protein n=1 Tax=Bursaphelenchus okinawaensis TaxID=465554 RepID=A0A811KCX4_9BILA|nr:unnamed protein product [Bursaphelenchus okinawaensis]CAG9101907.1 unnamed protein product [Bursaphelenchus okinawaensis]